MTSAKPIISLAEMNAFRLGALLVEPALRRLVRQDGRDQVIEPKVMLVLVSLAKAQGKVLAREELISSCWGNRAVSDDAIHRIVSRLRALSLDIGAGCFQIETLNKVGYRLLAASPDISAKEPPPAIQFTEAIENRPSRLHRRRLLIGIGTGAFALALGGGYAAFRYASTPPSGSAVIVMLVLPFDTLSNDAIAPLFARQVSEALRDNLGQVSGIRVIAAASSQAIAHQQLAASQIRQHTGADLLVEGSTTIANGTAQVSLALTDTHTDRQLWSASISGTTDDLLQLQNEVMAQLIQQIAPRINSGESTAVGPTYHRDPEVYRLTKQAQEMLEKVRILRMSDQSEPALEAADEADSLVRQALDIDANDPESLLVLAQLARNGWTRKLAAQPLTTMQRATASLEYIRKALLSDAANPSALVFLGDYYRKFEWRWNDAEALFKRALAINPCLVEAHWSYGYELGTLGNAVAGLDHALTLHQLDSQNPWHRVALPRLLYVCGQYKAAMQRYYAVLTEASDNVFLVYEIYFTLLTMRNAPALRHYVERLSNSWLGKPMPSWVKPLLHRINAAIDALNGQPKALVAQLDADVAAFNTGGLAAATLQGRARDDLPFIFAIEYAWSGQFDQAITMLDKALSARSLYWPACLPYGLTPFPAQMRDDARYQALWSRDPRLADAVARRRAAVENRLMAGTLEDGSSVMPVLPPSMLSRIRSAVAMDGLLPEGDSGRTL